MYCLTNRLVFLAINQQEQNRKVDLEGTPEGWVPPDRLRHGIIVQLMREHDGADLER